MEHAIRRAVAADAEAIADLHAESWRTAYRGFLPDSFLDGPVHDERRRFWAARMAEDPSDRRLVATALGEDGIVGFACVLLDAEPAWGALLDNLHVAPALRGRGIGRALLQHAREWIARVAPGTPMHLTVIEANVAARGFYDRQGGRVVEREIVEVIPGTRLHVLRYSWDPPASSINPGTSANV